MRDSRTGRTRLFSPEPVFMDQLDRLGESSIKRFRMVFTDENPETIRAVSEWFYKRLTDPSPVLDHQEKKALDRQLDRGTSKGHWFRGV